MAAKKRVGQRVEKQGRKQAQKRVTSTRRASAKAAASTPVPTPASTPASTLASPAPHPESGARVFPLAALRAALGTEVDRVRTYGGYTLILRRGRPVAAVIPYEEFERYTMRDSSEQRPESDPVREVGHSPDRYAGIPPRASPQELMAAFEQIRLMIAQSDAERLARGLPVNRKPMADVIREMREERTQQIIDAARGKT
jgi:prevent-host-death family protein